MPKRSARPDPRTRAGCAKFGVSADRTITIDYTALVGDASMVAITSSDGSYAIAFGIDAGSSQPNLTGQLDDGFGSAFSATVQGSRGPEMFVYGRDGGRRGPDGSTPN